MSESATTYEGSVLWTLEEISRLVSHSGNPAETLANIVQLIQRLRILFARDMPAREPQACVTIVGVGGDALFQFIGTGAAALTRCQREACLQRGYAFIHL